MRYREIAFEAALAIVQHRMVGVAQPGSANPLVQIPGRLVRVRIRVRARVRVRVSLRPFHAGGANYGTWARLRPLHARRVGTALVETLGAVGGRGEVEHLVTVNPLVSTPPPACSLVTTPRWRPW